jgi:hypothetical protein
VLSAGFGAAGNTSVQCSRTALAAAFRPEGCRPRAVTKADGSLSITEAAKALAMRPKDLFQWLAHNGWIYKRPNGAAAPPHTRGSTPGAISDASACARALDPQAAVS